jgi:hypothetical protein
VAYYFFGAELLALLQPNQPQSDFSNGLDPGVPVGDAVSDQLSRIRFERAV